MSIKETIQVKFKQYRTAIEKAADSDQKLDAANQVAEWLAGYQKAASDFEIPAEDVKAAAIALRVVEADISAIESEFELEALLAG